MRNARTMRPGLAILMALPVLSLLTSCATVSSTYVPQTVGPADLAENVNGLQISILSSTERVTKGKPVTFEAVIRNTGAEAYWVPREPRIIFIWVYPNGQRDNFVREYPSEEYFNQSDAVLLQPGESMRASFTIKTHYFPKTGITEFRAVYLTGNNTNPKLQPFWQGRATSNAFGVLVDKPYGPGSNRSAASTGPISS